MKGASHAFLDSPPQPGSQGLAQRQGSGDEDRMNKVISIAVHPPNTGGDCVYQMQKRKVRKTNLLKGKLLGSGGTGFHGEVLPTNSCFLTPVTQALIPACSIPRLPAALI